IQRPVQHDQPRLRAQRATRCRSLRGAPHPPRRDAPDPPRRSERRRLRRGVPGQSRVGVRHGRQPRPRRRRQRGARSDARLTDAMHPRASLSAISTFSWELDADLAFYADAGITNVGISVAKLERFGWGDGTLRVVDAGLRVTNLIGLGPFHLAEPDRWDAQRERILRALDTATEVGAECLVFTTGPAGPLPWEEAADALEAALAPVLHESRSRGVPFAIEHTNSLRVDIGFVHTLSAAIDLA